MTALGEAIDVLFADPNIATDAVYTPAGGGGPITMRVVVRRPDEIVGLGDTRLYTRTAVFDVRVSDVPAPVAGDQLTVAGETFVVQGEPMRDAQGLVWALDTRPVS